MPDTPSITINKEITYRGLPEITGNTYHFSGTKPTTDAGWHDLALAIWNAERTFLDGTTKFVGYLGYDAGNPHAVSIKNYNEDGTTKPTGALSGLATKAPGDMAVWVRWTTPERTSRGKRIYLRKYFHEVPYEEDAVPSSTKALMLTYANKMIDGTLPGGVRVCGPQGAVASMPYVSPWVTTRTLKRRGKRPSR